MSGEMCLWVWVIWGCQGCLREGVWGNLGVSGEVFEGISGDFGVSGELLGVVGECLGGVGWFGGQDFGSCQILGGTR